MTNQNIIHFQKYLRQSDAYLHFSDGTVFKGKINRSGDFQEILGEATFTTAMMGYEETITDPSFLGQHIIFSTAHVGNYPSNKNLRQAKTSFATSVIARNFSPNQLWEQLDIPLISGIDTRAVIKYLSQNTIDHRCFVTNSRKSIINWDNQKLHCDNLELVSQKNRETIILGLNPIVLINYGVKNAILERLKKMNYPLVTVPYDISFKEIKELNPLLVFLSNGPGDPRTYHPQIQVVKELLKANIPIRGICLGHQLLGLAMGIEVIKLPTGQRGTNHPVFDYVTGDLLITSQNHGYALADNFSNDNIFISHRSFFDHSIEGIASYNDLFKSVQFHPEAHPGPHDADIFFQEIESFLNKKITPKKSNHELHKKKLIPFPKIKNHAPKNYNKILIIGPGPIKIGQASEFDYSATQALKSLKEIGVKTVLLNSNPATIMTDPNMCDATYIEPITLEVVLKIIEKENIDAILSTMGGQTALNLCVSLEKGGYLKEKKIQLLGAGIWTIEHTEDRELFACELDKLGYKTGKRFKAFTEWETLELAQNTIGFPLIIRRDFALGGSGAALFYNIEDLKKIFTTDIKFPITMEKSLVGFKEIELEVMVDCEKNGIIVCSIENIDPCGIHTGDSITVAPAQTISDRCYQNLRIMSLTIAKHLGVVAGGANVQFAINPYDEDDIIVIEMNPRVSRSSALASKATGYPIAKISALLALGYRLTEILNDITKVSPVSFEPTLDYVALKIPIFPFNKFPTSTKTLGPSMRSVGEVLALGANFNEAFFKALRSLEMGLEIPSLNRLTTTPLHIDKDYLKSRLKKNRELSLLTCLESLRIGMSVEEIHQLTNISKWFIQQMELIFCIEEKIKRTSENKNFSENKNIDTETLLLAKQFGMSDKHIAMLLQIPQAEVFKLRTTKAITPIFKAVDTCSGEFKAHTPYFYSTYNHNNISPKNEASALNSNGGQTIVILGAGPNRIGQGIEFDYSCVKASEHLKDKNILSIMVNSNPETVSTDYDSSSRLYLAPLYEEDIFDILLHERPDGIIASFAGQTGIHIREHLEKGFRKKIYQFNFLGPRLTTLKLTEDRKLFSLETQGLGLAHTKSIEVHGYKNLENALIEIGFPVIIRPSYVIGGESMYIFHDFKDLNQLPEILLNALKTSHTTFQVETYLENAMEYDVDLIRDKFGNTVFAISEHIEYAGVHSGDSGMITPPVILTSKIYHQMKNISCELSHKLNIIGPVNFQFAVKDSKIYCIEANPRGSRTLPFLSKSYGISLPSIATDAMLGLEIKNWEREFSPYFYVKQSTFPFDRFIQDNIILGPKMRSTGETMGVDTDKESAILKSYLGNYPGLLTPGKILVSLADDSKEIILPYLKQLIKLGYEVLATSGTAQYIQKQGIPCITLAKINESGISILEIMKDPDLRLVLNTPLNKGSSKSDGEHIRNSAIVYGVPCFTRPENIKAILEALIGTDTQNLTPISLQEINYE